MDAALPVDQTFLVTSIGRTVDSQALVLFHQAPSPLNRTSWQVMLLLRRIGLFVYA